MAPQLWEIKLLVETDDPVAVERLADAVGDVACSVPPGETHACDPPWFVVTTPLDDDAADDWRGVLNR